MNKKIIICVALLFTFLSREIYSQTEKRNKIENSIGMFIGGATNFNPSSTMPSLGIDYDFQVPNMRKFLLLGLYYEYSIATLGEHAFGAAILLKPYKELTLGFGPGMTIKKNEEGGEYEKDFVIRISLSAPYNFGEWFVKPGLSFDFKSGEFGIVYGFVIGYSFVL